MFIQKFVDIHLFLPTTDNPSARKEVILGPAEFKGDITTYPGASNRFIIVLLNQFSLPSIIKAVHPQRKKD